MIYKIESKQNQKIKDLMKLSQSKFSKETKQFRIEGFHALEMAKESGALVSVFITKPVASLDVPQYLVSEEIMEYISVTKSPQGIVCVCNFIKEKPISSDKVLLLDNINDPGNLGTLLRTALAFGYKDVILLGGCSQYNEKVLQSTQGAIFKLNITNNFDEKILKKYKVIATEIKGSVDISTVSNIGSHILILVPIAFLLGKSILQNGGIPFGAIMFCGSDESSMNFRKSSFSISVSNSFSSSDKTSSFFCDSAWRTCFCSSIDSVDTPNIFTSASMTASSSFAVIASI